MVKRLAAFVLFFNCAVSVFAQTIKTDVLVIGGSPAGVAAALQCAHSKVKTMLVEQGERLCPQLTGKVMTNSLPDASWPGGLWGDLRNHLIAHYHSKPGYDTTFNGPLLFAPDTAAAILSGMADTAKNLTVQLNTTFVKIVKDDDRWDVSLMYNGNKQTIKARVVVDATTTGAVMTAAGGTYKTDGNWYLTFDNNLYRTAVAMGKWMPMPGGKNYAQMHDAHLQEYAIPMKGVLAKGVDNLLVTGLQWPEADSTTVSFNLRPDMALGQGAGVTAAYCAFFKTTTANLRVRLAQGELLDFKGGLIPIDDLGADPYWRAIQQVCATGILKPLLTHSADETTSLFKPDSIVTTAEIKPVMLEIYTRAFIWFNKEKPGTQFTVGNLLSFISELSLTDPENLQKSISKAWTEQYKFKGDFDPDKPITRREFAILANRYLNPFARTVDLDGRVVN